MRLFRGQLRSLGQPLLLSIVVGCLHLSLANSAYGACGDWLEHSADEEAKQKKQLPGDSPISCRGPKCQKAPESPLQESPKRTWTGEEDQRFHPEDPARVIRSRLSHRLVEGTLILPEGLRSRVERPPRG